MGNRTSFNSLSVNMAGPGWNTASDTRRVQFDNEEYITERFTVASDSRGILGKYWDRRGMKCSPLETRAILLDYCHFRHQSGITKKEGLVSALQHST